MIKISLPSDVRDNEPNLPGGVGPGYHVAEFIKVVVTSGDQTTLAEIKTDDGIIGAGVARRRKGDRRNDDLGVSLALARAFQDASDGYAGLAEELLR